MWLFMGAPGVPSGGTDVAALHRDPDAPVLPLPPVLPFLVLSYRPLPFGIPLNVKTIADLQ